MYFFDTPFVSNHSLAFVVFYFGGSHRGNSRAPGFPTYFWKCLGLERNTDQAEKVGGGPWRSRPRKQRGPRQGSWKV